MQANIDGAMSKLGLDGLAVKKEILSYMNKEIDPHVQSLVKFLVRKRPKKILEGIRDWLCAEEAKNAAEK